MPYLKFQSNKNINENDEFIKKLSKFLADELGKPENYIMISIEDSVKMLFAGTEKPSAFIELKSINLPDSKTPELSKNICAFINNEVGIPEERIYIEFENAKGSMWGWNGTTF